MGRQKDTRKEYHVDVATAEEERRTNPSTASKPTKFSSLVLFLSPSTTVTWNLNRSSKACLPGHLYAAASSTMPSTTNTAASTITTAIPSTVPSPLPPEK